MTAATGLLLVGVLAGCAGTEPQAGSGPTSSRAPEVRSTSGPVEPTPGATSEESPELTGPAAARGPRLTVEALAVRAPDGFRRVEGSTPFAVSAVSTTGERGTLLPLVRFPLLSGPGPLDDLARAFLNQFESGGRIIATRTVGGVELAQLRGMSDGVLTEKLATEYASDQYTITFSHDPTLEGDRTARRELVESVLASVEWS